VPDLPLTEAVEMMRLDPGLSFCTVVQKGRVDVVRHAFTKTAVDAFQSAHGLAADGWAGKVTTTSSQRQRWRWGLVHGHDGLICRYMLFNPAHWFVVKRELEGSGA
jgi:hypothetical protein